MRKVNGFTTLILLFLIAGLLPVLAIGLYSYYVSATTMTEQVHRQQGMFAEVVEGRLADFVSGREADAYIAGMAVEVVSGMQAWAKADWDTANLRWTVHRNNELQRFVQTYVEQNGYALLFLIIPDRQIVPANREEHIGTVVSQQDYFQQAHGERGRHSKSRHNRSYCVYLRHRGCYPPRSRAAGLHRHHLYCG